jgi:hypothetical protein
MNLPSFSTGVRLISSGGMTGGGSGPAIAFLVGPVTWAKALEQTIDVPRITPQITQSFDLTSRIEFTPTVGGYIKLNRFTSNRSLGLSVSCVFILLFFSYGFELYRPIRYKLSEINPDSLADADSIGRIGTEEMADLPG